MIWLLFRACGAVPIFWHMSHRRQETFRTGWSAVASVSYMPCAVKLAFAFSSTVFSSELIHKLVFISVFRFDFGDFFLFITVKRVLWLAKLDWTFQECNLLCWGCLV